MQETQIVLRDDLTGKVIDGEKATTQTFAVGNKVYELDLAPESVEKFNKALAPFVEVARPVTKTRRRRSTARTNISRNEKTAQIRQWAQDQGMEVSSRGRISREIISAYEKAHQKKESDSKKD